MSIFLVSVLVYSAALAALGLLLSASVRKAGDFLVAGRRLSTTLVFATFLAANIGAGSTVGAASLGYRIGWSAWWWVGSAALGCFVLGNTVAPRIWELAREQEFHSLGDFLEWRYSRSVRGAVAAILWTGSLGLLAAQLIALSLLFQVVAGVPSWVGAIIGGLLMTVYFAAGGLFSAARVNLVQLAVLLAGFLLTVPMAAGGVGGWSEIGRRLAPTPHGIRPDFWSLVGIGPAGVLNYLALLTPAFIASPGLVQKAYGARSAAAARVGITLNALALLLFAAVPPAIGIIAAAGFPGLADPQFAMFHVMTRLVPPWLGVLGLLAVFSAEVSTCDAVLSMLTTAFTIDMYKGFLRPGASQAEILRVSRVSAVGAGALGVAVAMFAASIIGSLSFFYGLLSVALFVPLICGLYSSRPDARAAMAAIIASTGAMLLLEYVHRAPLPGGLGSVPAGIVVSFATLWLHTLAREARGAADPSRR